MPPPGKARRDAQPEEAWAPAEEPLENGGASFGEFSCAPASATTAAEVGGGVAVSASAPAASEAQDLRPLPALPAHAAQMDAAPAPAVEDTFDAGGAVLAPAAHPPPDGVPGQPTRHPEADVANAVPALPPGAMAATSATSEAAACGWRGWKSAPASPSALYPVAGAGASRPARFPEPRSRRPASKPADTARALPPAIRSSLETDSEAHTFAAYGFPSLSSRSGLVVADVPPGAAQREVESDGLRVFCLPGGPQTHTSPPMPLAGSREGARFHSFCMSRATGRRRYGHCVSIFDTAPNPAFGRTPSGAPIVALCLVFMSDWPLARLLDRALRALLDQRLGGAQWGEVCLAAEKLMDSLTKHGAHDVRFLLKHPLWHPEPPSTLCAQLRWRPMTVARVLATAMAEGKMLLHSTDAGQLLPAAQSLLALLSPLSWTGLYIPYLPAELHASPAELVRDSPLPFIIGCETSHLRMLQPLPTEVLLVDLRSADVSGASGTEVWAQSEAFAPMRAAIASQASHAARGDKAPAALAAQMGNDPRDGVSALQAAALTSMALLLDPEAALRQAAAVATRTGGARTLAAHLQAYLLLSDKAVRCAGLVASSAGGWRALPELQQQLRLLHLEHMASECEANAQTTRQSPELCLIAALLRSRAWVEHIVRQTAGRVTSVGLTGSSGPGGVGSGGGGGGTGRVGGGGGDGSNGGGGDRGAVASTGQGEGSAAESHLAPDLATLAESAPYHTHALTQALVAVERAVEEDCPWLAPEPRPALQAEERSSGGEVPHPPVDSMPHHRRSRSDMGPFGGSSSTFLTPLREAMLSKATGDSTAAAPSPAGSGGSGNQSRWRPTRHPERMDRSNSPVTLPMPSILRRQNTVLEGKYAKDKEKDGIGTKDKGQSASHRTLVRELRARGALSADEDLVEWYSCALCETHSDGMLRLEAGYVYLTPTAVRFESTLSAQNRRRHLAIPFAVVTRIDACTDPRIGLLHNSILIETRVTNLSAKCSRGVADLEQQVVVETQDVLDERVGASGEPAVECKQYKLCNLLRRRTALAQLLGLKTRFDETQRRDQGQWC